MADNAPLCCGEEMVSYLGGWIWECSVAFFDLHDAEAIDDMGATPPILNDDATAEQRQWHQHLLSTRIEVSHD